MSALPGSPYFAWRGDQLFVEELSLDALANEHGTPLYVYSRSAMQAALAAHQRAVPGRAQLICYALKANSTLAVLQTIALAGCGFDIVSVGELERVLAAGGDPAKVVFSGVEEVADASGVYTNFSGSLQPVADYGAPLPGGGGTFTGFPYLLRSETMLADGRTVFFAKTSKPAPSGSVFAIFASGPDGLSTLVEEQTTPIPGGTGVFKDLRRVVADDDGSLAFEGLGDSGQRGLYTLRDGALRTVFDANTPIKMMLKQVHAEPPRPSEVRPGCDARLEAICLRALSKKPADRFQSARAMRSELLRDSGPIRYVPTVPPSAAMVACCVMEAAPKRSATPTLVLSVFAVILAATALVLALR